MNLEKPIYQTILFKEVHSNYPRITKKITENKGIPEKNLSEIYKFLNESESYLLDVFLTSHKIADTFEQLEHIPIYIKYFRNSKTYNEAGINKAKHMQYHMESHFIKIISILDLCLILINNVYKLGLIPQRCSFELVTQNLNVINTKAVKLIKLFKKSVVNIAKQRNLIVHRSTYYDEDIIYLNTLFFLQNNPTENCLYSEDELKDELEFCSKLFLMDKIKLLLKNNIAVLNFLLPMFKVLGEDFKSKYNSLI